MSVMDLFLGLAGMPADQVAAIDHALPGIARVADHLRAVEPVLQQMKPHIDALEPLLVQAWPAIQAALPDFLASVPAIDDLIEFAASKS